MSEQRFINTEDLPIIAQASSFGRDNQIRWTELGLYHRPGDRRPFVAESRGRSKVMGEVDFRRQRAAKTIEDAMHLFDNSRLRDEVYAQAQSWLDQNSALDRSAPVVRFDGAGGLRGALLWLYPDTSKDAPANQLAKLFQYDFGVPVRTVEHGLSQERDGEGLPSWCKAFLGALQHFDREAFHAARRP